MKLKHITLQTILMAGATWSLTSCNDFLDMAPLDQVTPQEYFNTTDHLVAYSISQYNNIFSTHGGYGVGTVNNDQNTDNMVAGGYSSTYFEKGQWRVPNTGGGWDLLKFAIAIISSKMCFLNSRQARLRAIVNRFFTMSAKCTLSVHGFITVN